MKKFDPLACALRQFGRLALLFFILLACGNAADASASDRKASREREALHRAQQQLARMQADMASIEQEKAGLAAELEKTQAASKAAEGKAARMERSLGASKKQLTSLAGELLQAREQLAATAQQLAEARNTLSQTNQTLRQTEAEKRDLETLRTHNERSIAACEGKNTALYELGRSLMERFEHKTCGEVLADKEPFTGIHKVQTENLLEEYRDKLDEQRIVQPPGG